MRAAVSLLAKGWYQGARTWWRATAVVLAMVAASVLLVVGSFEGMEGATQERIEAFYTGDLRITPGKPGAAPDDYFNNTTAPLGVAATGGGRVDGRIETTYILTRQRFLENFLEEDEQFRVDLPGSTGDGDFYGVGVLVGLDLRDAGAAERLRPYRTVGSFPQPSDADDGIIPIMLSSSRFKATLTEEEIESLGTWPPQASQLGQFPFELTTARVDPNSPWGDVIRIEARVVGLFESDLDAMDAITLITDIGDARRLLGVDPDTSLYNVVTVRGGDLEATRAAVDDAGWQHEGPDAFSKRYIGQLVEAVSLLSLVVVTLFFTFPVFLLWHGLTQVLDRNEREVAVCRAIGVPDSVIRMAVIRLAGSICLGGLLGATVLTLIVGGWLAYALPAWQDSPLPLDFRLPWWGIPATVAVVLGSAAASAVVTIRAHERTDLASRLRSA